MLKEKNMNDSEKKLDRFKKSFLLHSSRYNLYSKDTLEKGSVGRHNRAVTALGGLTDRVIADPSLYSDLLLKLLEDDDPKTRLCAGLTCLHANIHGEKAIDTLVSIARNIPKKSMICEFDISGSITKFKKKQVDAKPRNEIDTISDMMKASSEGAAYTDTEIIEMIMKLPSVDLCGHDGRTSLIHACIANRFELVKKIVELGADVNVKDIYQNTALHCAVVVGSVEITALLLNQKVKVNEPAKGGWTALDFAISNPNGSAQEQVDQLTELLISNGAKRREQMNG